MWGFMKIRNLKDTNCGTLFQELWGKKSHSLGNVPVAEENQEAVALPKLG